MIRRRVANVLPVFIVCCLVACGQKDTTTAADDLKLDSDSAWLEIEVSDGWTWVEVPADIEESLQFEAPNAAQWRLDGPWLELRFDGLDENLAAFMSEGAGTARARVLLVPVERSILATSDQLERVYLMELGATCTWGEVKSCYDGKCSEACCPENCKGNG